ncbi:MAG: hypothetical protein ACRC5H_08910, partial [Treponemataceae bacterium]
QDSDQRLQNQHLQEKTTAQEKIEVEIPSGMSNAANTIPVEKITTEIPLQDMRKVTDTQHLSETEEKITAQEKIEVEIPSGMSNATNTIPVEKITAEIPLQNEDFIVQAEEKKDPPPIYDSKELFEDESFLSDDNSEENRPIDCLFDGGQWQAEQSAEKMSMVPSSLQGEMKSMLLYMDKLLENLPEDKIQEFAESEYFQIYENLFNELGLL